jgi:hypothetical protein
MKKVSTSNSKPFWSWIKSFTKRADPIPDLHHQGKTITSATGKALVLNCYFLSVFTREKTSAIGALRERLAPIVAALYLWMKKPLVRKMFIYECLCKIDPSKSCGPDEIPGRLLKEGSSCLANQASHTSFQPLYRIRHASQRLDISQHHSAVQKGLEVFKLSSNCRPISLISIIVS